MKKTIRLNKEEYRNVDSACSIIQELEHLYDGLDVCKMRVLGDAYDILAEVIEDNKDLAEDGI